MFAVLFEVHPRPELWDAYLGHARLLRPELEQIDGFVDNVRYRSLTRSGWVLSLSSWRDEKAVVRWRTHARHHEIQQRGRDEIFLDYHLRVGQLTRDTRLPDGCALREQRLDETEVGAATTVTLIDARQPAAAPAPASPAPASAAPAPATAAPAAPAAAVPAPAPALDPLVCARGLGLAPDAAGLVAWDVFDAVLTPGDAILLASWRDQAAAIAFEAAAVVPDGARLRRIRIVRDYGMFDRREAPQYYPAAAPRS